MRSMKYILFGILALAISAQAGGAASLVGQKSSTKDYKYSFQVEYYFVAACSQNANEWICECVLDQLQHQYSEAEFLYINEQLEEGASDSEFEAYMTMAVEHCDEEYTKVQHNPSKDKFSKDIDRVLRDVAGLQTTGHTDLGGRRKQADKEFNEGYAEGGSGGIGDGLAGLLGGGGGGIATKAKGTIKIPSARDIVVKSENDVRPASDIMKVVRQRTPGLRHIYNKFLKQKPGFDGVVTLKFSIAPSGEVLKIKIDDSTTGYGEFDGEVKKAVSRWKFGKVKSGKTLVTIPFTFSE